AVDREARSDLRGGKPTTGRIDARLDEVPHSIGDFVGEYAGRQRGGLEHGRMYTCIHSCASCRNSNEPKTTALTHLARLPPQEVHEDELAERHRVREVRLSLADLRDAFHELDERTVPREHERVDHDSRAPTVGDLA